MTYNPNFLIIGVQKAGTTSLHNYLCQHQDVYMSSPKELHFFDSCDNITAIDYKKYLENFNQHDNYILRGEATPIYFYYPGCIEKIKKYCPEIKILVVLRNPIDRAYSHYWHEKKLGWEELSFTDAMNRERNNSETYHRHYSYIDRSLYSIQLKKLYRHFDTSSVLIMKFEELIENPLTVTNLALQFCSPEIGALKTLDAEPKNLAKTPRSQSILWLSAHLNRKLGENYFCGALRRINNKQRKYPALSKVDRALVAKLLLEKDPELVDLYPELLEEMR